VHAGAEVRQPAVRIGSRVRLELCFELPMEERHVFESDVLLVLFSISSSSVGDNLCRSS
jgi:hypothetical protein